MPADGQGTILTGLARAAVAARLGIPCPPPDTAAAEWLEEPGATFVTLTRFGQLRGCIGSLEANRPLADDLRENALAAAFRDPRFTPLTREEFDDIRFEVSLLGPLEPLPPHSSEEDVIALLRPDIDGVVFRFGSHGATFLPQVWEKLPEPHMFLAQLKLKAGLPPSFWHEDVLISRYQVHKFHEAPPE